MEFKQRAFLSPAVQSKRASHKQEWFFAARNFSLSDVTRKNRVFSLRSEKDAVNFVLWIYSRHDDVSFQYLSLGTMHDSLPSAFIVHIASKTSLVVNCMTWMDIYHYYLAFSHGKRGRFFIYGIGAFRPAEIPFVFKEFRPDISHGGGRGTFSIYTDVH